jgi:hypothetical protein
MTPTLHKGIAGFVGGYGGTIEPGAKIMMVANEPPEPGWGIYRNGERFASVILDASQGDTKERLQEKLEALYRG